MQIVVREVTEDDIPALLRLLRAKAEFDGMPDLLQATHENLRDELFCAHPTAHAIVATLDGVVVGMATYFQTYSSFLMKPGLWLDDLYVEQERRNVGVGRALLTYLCQAAAKNDCARIDWIVTADNDDGLRFYKSMGAEIFETVRLARIDEATIRAHAESA